MSPAAWRWCVAAVFLLALVARLAAIFALHRWDDAMPGASRQFANSLIEFGGFYYRDWTHFGPSSVITPAYPLLLAALFQIFGAETPTAYFAALAVNAIFGAACAAATMALTRRLLGPGVLAVAAGALVALWPPQIIASLFAQPMALTALVLVAACLLWQRMCERDDLMTGIGFAIAAALAALLEQVMLLALPIALAAIVLFRSKPVDVRIRNAALLAAAGMLFIWPWVARNQAVHGRWLMTTSLWQRVWMGANENATGSDRLPLTPERRAASRSLITGDESLDDAVRPPMMQIDLLPPAARYELRSVPEANREDQFRAWSGEYIRANRARWLMQLPLRMLKVWFIDWDHPLSRNLLAIVPRTLLAIAALVGGIVFAQQRGGVGAIVTVLVLMVLSAALTVATAKQTIVIEPLQIMLAIAGASLLRQKTDDAAEVEAKAAQVA